MRQTLIAIIFILGSLISVTGYCMALVDWFQDVREGIYQENHLEGILETSALGFYTFLAIRFTKNKMSL